MHRMSNYKYLIVAVFFRVVFCFLAFSSTPSMAGSDGDVFNAQTPNMKAGQLFTLKIVPAGREIDIFVAGYEAKKIVFSELKLRASITSGERQWFVPTKTKDGHFRLSRPKDLPTDKAAELKIEVKHSGDTEDFKFEIESGLRPK